MKKNDNMLTILVTVIMLQMLTWQYQCLHVIVLSDNEITPRPKAKKKSEYELPINYEPYPLEQEDYRRYKVVWQDPSQAEKLGERTKYEDEKDLNIKYRIATLVQQSVHDTERRLQAVQDIRAENRNKLPYRAGFIFYLIHKHKKLMEELLDVTVKHGIRAEATMEQVKFYELILHTKVDIMNYITQLTIVHEQYLKELSSMTEENPIEVLKEAETEAGNAAAEGEG